VTDHFMPNTPDRVGDTLEAWSTLAALTRSASASRASTRRVRC